MSGTLLGDSIQFGSIKSNSELEEHRGKLNKLRNYAQTLRFEMMMTGAGKGDPKSDKLEDRYNRAKKEANLEAAYVADLQDFLEMKQCQRSNFKDDAEWAQHKKDIKDRKEEIERKGKMLADGEREAEGPIPMMSARKGSIASLGGGPSRNQTTGWVKEKKNN